MTEGSDSTDLVEAIANYLDNDGGVAVLCELRPKTTRHKDLLESVPISKGTLSSRLERGQELGLIEKVDIDGGRGSSHAYVLTDRGMAVRDCLKYSGVHEKHQTWQALEQEYEEQVADVQALLSENPVVIQSPEKGDERLRVLREEF